MQIHFEKKSMLKTQLVLWSTLAKSKKNIGAVAIFRNRRVVAEITYNGRDNIISRLKQYVGLNGYSDMYTRDIATLAGKVEGTVTNE